MLGRQNEAQTSCSLNCVLALHWESLLKWSRNGLASLLTRRGKQALAKAVATPTLMPLDNSFAH